MPNSLIHSLNLSWYSAIIAVNVWFFPFHLCCVIPLFLSRLFVSSRPHFSVRFSFFLNIIMPFHDRNDNNKFIIRNYVGLFHFILILLFVFSMFFVVVRCASFFLIHFSSFWYCACVLLFLFWFVFGFISFWWFDASWINKMV